MICEVLKILCKTKFYYKLIKPCFSSCDISFMYLTINTKKVVSKFGDTIFVTIFVTLISDKYNE